MLVTVVALAAIWTLTIPQLPVTEGRPRSPLPNIENQAGDRAATPANIDGAAHFPLTLDDLAKLGMAPEELLAMLKERASAVSGHRLGHCDHTRHHRNEVHRNTMDRFYLRNKTVSCNDGSSAGYYLRRSPESDRWLVFLEGGWYCFDRTSCHGRWINTPQLMSSERWPERRKGTGILSSEEEENPYLHNANIVYVPYCSSDSWSGTYSAQHKGDFSFMGSLIIEEVIKQLLSDHHLAKGKRLILAGSSAGGTGVLLNIDRVAGVMAERAPQVEVRGIADSGWFLDNQQYKKVPCTDAHLCAPTEGIQRGINLWHGRVPERCKERERWKCYFGYRIYATLKTPIFVVQHLFDEAQITADNVGPPVKKEQWRYIHNMGKDMKHTLINVSAVFAPACLSHITLTRSEWHKVSIDGVTLPQALACWEGSQRERNHYNPPSSYLTPRLITGEYVSRSSRHKYLSDDPFKSRGRRKKHRKKRNRGKKRKRRKGRRKEQRDGERMARLQPSSPNRARRSLWFDQHDIHHIEYHENQCNHHRLDHCAWPQCNLSCPKIHNPFTGEEMDFIDLLLQFGLDLSSIANALGMDLPTLQSMDHDLLLRKLIQQS